MNERLTESFFDLGECHNNPQDEAENLGNDFKSINNAFLYIGGSTNYQSDLFNYDLDNLDFSTLYPVVAVKRQLFCICKIHKRGCGHKKRIGRGRIKGLVEKDITSLLKGYKNKRFRNLERFYKLDKGPRRDRKRLYDEDVIVKKIMSNFFKFIRLVVKSLYKSTVSELTHKYFFNVPSCQEYLNKTALNTFIKTTNNTGGGQDILTWSLDKVFDSFVESYYYHSYLVEKLKTTFDENYICAFINYTKQIRRK
jgi:hypothetical protein